MVNERAFDATAACDGHFHQWRILTPEEVAEHHPGERRGVAVATCCGVQARLEFVDGEKRWRVIALR